MAGTQRAQEKKKLERVHERVDGNVSHFLLLNTHTPPTLGCPHLINLWFLVEAGGRLLIKK